MIKDAWFKSNRSNNNGSCVEVRHTGGAVQVRDTKDNGTGPILSFTEAEWTAFVGGVEDGDFTL